MQQQLPYGVQPQIILLKEGTDTSQGKAQLISNINACMLIADNVRTTLGPRGMDKMIVDSQGKTTISNDGATILNKLQIVHPAARAALHFLRIIAIGTAKMSGFQARGVRRTYNSMAPELPLHRLVASLSGYVDSGLPRWIWCLELSQPHLRTTR